MGFFKVITLKHNALIIQKTQRDLLILKEEKKTCFVIVLKKDKNPNVAS